MAKLVFGVHGLRGSLNNSVALAKELVDAGHDVTVVSFRDVESTARSVGADFVQLVDGPKAAESVRAAVRAHGPVRSLALARRRRRELLQLVEARAILRELGPDLAIIDMEMHGLVLAAHAEALSTLLSVPWHDVFYGPERPPMHTDLAPGSTIVHKLRIRLAWQQTFLRRRLGRTIAPVTRAGLAARVMPFQLNTPEWVNLRAMAANMGIDLAAIASTKHWMKPVVYTHAPVLSYSVRELELDPDAAHGVVHVGPMIDPDRDPPDDTSRRVEQFIAAAEGRGCSIAYCSMGSLQPANREYYRTVIDAFAGLDGWALIIGLGGQGAATSLGESTADLLLLDEAPQLQILDRATVAVHPGGTGTFYECVRSAVPSVVLHTGHVDMPGIAARVDHHHLGRSIDRRKATAGLLAAAVVDVVSSPVIERSLSRHREVLQDYRRRGAAGQLVADILGSAPPSVPGVGD